MLLGERFTRSGVIGGRTPDDVLIGGRTPDEVLIATRGLGFPRLLLEEG
jgi:hypothetical protein